MNQMMNQKIYDIIVIGAGISALVFSQRMKKKGFDILLVEKSKSVGGRMATRRDDNSRYDHGAQFIKLEDPELLEIKNELRDQKIVFEWFNKNDTSYFATELGMTKVAKYLEKNLPFVFSEKATHIKIDSDQLMTVVCESGQSYQTRKLVLSCPWPQSRELLINSNIQFPEALQTLNYHKALAGLFELSDQNEILNQFKYTEKVDEHIHSVSNQKSKKVSENNCFTVVMTSDFSHKNFELSDQDIHQKIIHHFSQWLSKQNINPAILKSQIKKWRYSHPEHIHTKKYELIGSDQNVYLIGDAFGGGSVQGAMLSAIHAAKSFN